MFPKDYTLDLSLVNQLKSFEQVQLKCCVPTSQGFRLRLIQRILITPIFSYSLRQCVSSNNNKEFSYSLIQCAPLAVIGFPPLRFLSSPSGNFEPQKKESLDWLSI